MFDLLFTEDTEIAGNTMEANMEATRQEIELSKKVVVNMLILKVIYTCRL